MDEAEPLPEELGTLLELADPLDEAEILPGSEVGRVDAVGVRSRTVDPPTFTKPPV